MPPRAGAVWNEVVVADSAPLRPTTKALSEKVVVEILERYGVSDVQMIRKFEVKYFANTGMARAIFYGRKPEK